MELKRRQVAWALKRNSEGSFDPILVIILGRRARGWVSSNGLPTPS